MKKKVFGRKLSRDTKSRISLFRSLAKSFIIQKDIKTTKSKALVVRPFIEELISLAKEGSLSSKRRLSKFLGGDRKLVKKLTEIAAEFKKESGFVRIIPQQERRGDNSKMVRLKLSQDLETKEKVHKEKEDKKEKKLKEKKD